MNKKNVLISGGLGYVGGRLCTYFSEKPNYKVYALSRTKTLEGYSTDVEVLSNDMVLNDNVLENVKIDVFIHLAAMNEVECIKDPYACNNVNINGTIKWLEWAKRKKVAKFVYFSTVHVYAKPLEGIFTEESATFPGHPYSISHKCAEDYVLSYHKEYQLDSAVIRLSNSFGYPSFKTANRWSLFINDICKQLVETGVIKIYSNMLQYRDFISLSNVCSAVDTIITYDIEEGDNRIFNLSAGESKSLEEIAMKVKNVAENYLGQKIDLIYDENKSQKPNSLTISNKKLKNIGWSPTEQHYDLEIERTLKFFMN